MTHYEIISKVLGPIIPTGQHGVDTDRLKNLEATIEVVDALILDIAEVAGSSHRHEASIKALGQCAAGFMVGIE